MQCLRRFVSGKRGPCKREKKIGLATKKAWRGVAVIDIAIAPIIASK